LVVIINSLKVPKIKKILLYELKFLVPNYSCLQNPWLRGYRPQIPVLSVLNWICWTPPEQNSWVRHCILRLIFYITQNNVILQKFYLCTFWSFWYSLFRNSSSVAICLCTSIADELWREFFSRALLMCLQPSRFHTNMKEITEMIGLIRKLRALKYSTAMFC